MARELDIAAQQTRSPEQVEDIRQSDEQKRRVKSSQVNRGTGRTWSLEEIQKLYDAGATREQVDLITSNRMSELDAWAMLGLRETEPEGLDEIRAQYSQRSTEEPFDVATRGPAPPPGPPQYPGGYLETLAIIDELGYQTPTADELSYEAPTYELDELGLPQVSEAAGAEADPYARETQRATLDRLRAQLLETGLGAEDIAALEQIQRRTEEQRLRGGREVTQRLGGAIGGEQVSGDIELANALRMASTEQESDVVAGMERRGAAAASNLGKYGGDLAQQTFREDFETGSAADRLARANAMATQGYQEDIAGLEQTAERWRAQAPLKEATLKQLPLGLKGQLAKTEAKARFSDEELAASMAQYNRSVEKANGVSFWDWLQPAVEFGAGAVATYFGAGAVGVPLMAKGTAGFVEAGERELNPRPTIETDVPVYGHGQAPDEDDDDTYRWGR